MPGRFRLSYVYGYSDTDKYYTGEKRDRPVERNVAASTLTNEHTVIGEYDVTERLSFIAEIPFLYVRQARDGPGSFGVNGVMLADGLGDVRVLGKYWLASENAGLRLYAAAGVRLPTGDSNSRFTSDAGNHITEDVAVQHGTGNGAAIAELGGTSQLHRNFGLFYSGRYVLTPSTETDARNFRNQLTGNGPRRNSDSDSASFKVGMQVPVGRMLRESVSEQPVPRLDGLAVFQAFSGAWVPYDDLVGATRGFRRAGTVLFYEPGFAWAPSPDVTFTVSVPITVYRKLQQNGGNLPEWILQASVTFAF
ncbi:MAG: hypothetical protein AB7O52_03100 [Planctomycetota bacterium]